MMPLEDLAVYWPVGTRVRHGHGEWTGVVTPAPAGDSIAQGHITICGADALVYIERPCQGRPGVIGGWFRPKVLSRMTTGGQDPAPLPRQPASRY